MYFDIAFESLHHSKEYSKSISLSLSLSLSLTYVYDYDTIRSLTLIDYQRSIII